MAEEKQNGETQDKWAQEGITFETVNMKNYAELKTYLEEAFFPDEPLFRSTKLFQGNGLVDRYIVKLISKFTIEGVLKQPTSIVARNKEGKIISAR